MFACPPPQQVTHVAQHVPPAGAVGGSPEFLWEGEKFQIRQLRLSQRQSCAALGVGKTLGMRREEDGGGHALLASWSLEAISSDLL